MKEKINNWATSSIEYDFTANKRNPYLPAKVSVILPAHKLEGFQKTIKSLSEHCSDFNSVEIIVKVDSEKSADGFSKCLMDGPFRFKLLVFPRYHAYWDQHLYINELCKLALGKVFWSLGDDMEIVSGDWVKALLSGEGKFEDDIYTLHIGEYPKRPKANPFPAISRGWWNFFGFFSLTSNVDYFTVKLGTAINRYISVPKNLTININHEGPHGYMRDDQKSPLSNKKNFVQNITNKYAKKFKRRY